MKMNPNPYQAPATEETIVKAELVKERRTDVLRLACLWIGGVCGLMLATSRLLPFGGVDILVTGLVMAIYWNRRYAAAA
jgi:hypothetical protein